MSERLTAEQVAAELSESRALFYATMDIADDISDTEEYEFNEAMANQLSSAIALIKANLIESPDERRERFERWHRDRFGDDAEGLELLEKDRDGGYESVIANAMWLAFNAALDFGGGGGE